MRRCLLAILGAQVCALALACPSALASGTGFAHTNFGPPEGFANPLGLAVDNTSGLAKGVVYVADHNNNAVDEFNATGSEVLKKVTLAGSAPYSMTVEEGMGPREGDLYVAGQGTGVIYRFAPNLAGEEEVIKGLSEPTGVAVDEQGFIFVSEYAGNAGESKLLEFNSKGEPVNAAGVVSAANTVAEKVYVPQALAVDASGEHIYVATQSGTTEYTLSKGVYTENSEPFDVYAANSVTLAPNGRVYVTRNDGEVAEFEASGGPELRSLGAGVLSGADEGVGYMASSGDLYVADYGNNTVYRFEEGPLPETPTTEAPRALEGNTATLAGKLAAGTTGYHFEYNSGAHCSGGPTTPESAGAPGETVSVQVTELQPSTEYTVCLVATNKYGPSSGVGVSFKTKKLPAIETLEGVGVTENVEKLVAKVDPEAVSVSACEFEVEEEPYEYPPRFQHTVVCEQTPSGSGSVSISANLPGLREASHYHVRLKLVSENGTEYSGETGFTTLGPALSAESVTGVGSAGATLRATIDPAGIATSYRFEYGATDAYGTNTPVEAIGNGSEPIQVTSALGDLAPNSEYHFRVVATSANGTKVTGADVAFRTLPQGIVGLPGGRVYEMTTPPEDENVDVFHPESWFAGEYNGPDSFNIFQVNPEGNAATFLGTYGKNGSGAFGGNQRIVWRTGPGQWSERNVAVAGNRAAPYVGFTSNLAMGFPTTCACIGGEPNVGGATEGYANIYARSLLGEVLGPLKALIVPVPSTLPAESRWPRITYGASSADDGGQMVFEARGQALTPTAEASTEYNNIYDAAGGQLSLVNVLPNGTTHANAHFGGLEGTATNLMSSDGSRVFWTDLNTGDLYLRENPTAPESPRNAQDECTVPTDACTVEVDKAMPGAVAASGGGNLWEATADGSQAFFTDEHQLTPGSTAAGGDPDLYEYELANEPGATPKLTDLTVDSHNGEHADVQGVLGISADGSYVYIAATGVLAENADPEGQKAQPQASSGLSNLYVLHDGVAKFIAVLPSGEGDAVPPYSNNNLLANSGGRNNSGDWRQPPGWRTSQVSPDGQALVFESDTSLTGYDNQGLAEVYVYELGDSKLFCTSCSPSGEPPPANVEGAAAFLPFGAIEDEVVMRWISSDGSRVFFDSAVPLVARDVNGAQDVYEWVREGTGGCTEERGCVNMLSSGTSYGASWLIGSGESGEDVFFATRSRLVAADRNENYDLYDARIGGVLAAAEAACSGTGCQGIPSAPPPFAAPASYAFSGAGNFSAQEAAAREAAESEAEAKPKAKAKPGALTRAQRLARALRACRKGPRHKRAGCEARARKQYGTRSAGGRKRHA